MPYHDPKVRNCLPNHTQTDCQYHVLPYCSTRVTEITICECKPLIVTMAEAQPHVVIIIVEQPSRQLRFRYECTSEHNSCLYGLNKTDARKTYPTIRLVNCVGKVKIIIKLYTYEPEGGQPLLHVHKLKGTNCSDDGICEVEVSVPEGGHSVEFKDFSVSFVPKKRVREVLRRRRIAQLNGGQLSGADENALRAEVEVIQSKINTAVLGFEAHFYMEDQQIYIPISGPVFSSPIDNLKAVDILAIDHNTLPVGFASGGQEIVLLTKKVKKTDIEVCFFHKDGWRVVIPGKKCNLVHYQHAIRLRTPAYEDPNITRSVAVMIELRRPSDGRFSSPVPFTYVPNVRDEVQLKRRIKPPNSLHIAAAASCQKRPRLQKPSNDMEAPSTSSIFTNPSERILETPVHHTLDGQPDLSSNSWVFAGSARSEITQTGATPSLNNRTLGSQLNDNSDVPNIPLAATNSSGQVLDTLVYVTSDGAPDFRSEAWVSISNDYVAGVSAESETIGSLPHLNEGNMHTVNPNSESDPYLSSTAPTQYLVYDSIFDFPQDVSPSSILNVCDTSPLPDLVNEVLQELWSEYSEPEASNTLKGNTLVSRGPAFEDDDTDDNLTTDGGHAVTTAGNISDGLKLNIDLERSMAELSVNDEIKLKPSHSEPELHVGILKTGMVFGHEEQVPTTSLSEVPIQSCENLLLQDHHGNSLLHLAAKNNQENIVQAICSMKNIEVLKFDTYNHNGYAPLHLAVLSKSLNCTKELCLAGCNVNIRTGTNGQTALHLAVGNESDDIIKFLLTQPTMDVNVQAFNGDTPLHLACAKKLETAVKFLILAKANPYIENYEEHETPGEEESRGKNCLHVAEGSQKIIQLLLSQVPNFWSQETGSSRRLSDEMPYNHYIAEEPIPNLKRKYDLKPVIPIKGTEHSHEFKAAFDMLSLGIRQQLAKLLDPPGAKNWKALLRTLNRHDLISECEPAESPTISLLIFIEANELYNGLENLGLKEALKVFNDFLCQTEDSQKESQAAELRFSSLVSEE